jgi:para-aminobenzoate synthetase/4-amino-4-deoxychorismate lyase
LHESDAGAEYAEGLLKGRFLTGVNAKFELIESMRYAAGEAAPEHLGLHLARLERSARFFGFAFDRAAVAAAVREAVAPVSAGIHKLRLLLRHDGRVSVTTSPAGEAPAGPRRVVLAEERVDSRSVFQRHKTTMRAHYERAYERAVAGGAHEVLFLNERGELAEAARHNVFVEKGGELLTPPLSAGVLDGVRRRLVLDDPTNRAREATLTPDDLARADRVFLTNAVRGVVEVELA